MFRSLMSTLTYSCRSIWRVCILTMRLCTLLLLVAVLRRLQLYLDKVLTLYCQYQAATYLLASLQMLVAHRLSDGDFEMARFEQDSLDSTVQRVSA